MTNPESETQHPATSEEAEAHVRLMLDKHLKDGLTDEVMGRAFDDGKSLNDLIESDPQRAIELTDSMFDWQDANGA